MAGFLKSINNVLKGRKPLAEVLPQIVDPGDPRVAISVIGGDWLCPFSGKRVPAPGWNGSSQTVLQIPEIRQHLLDLPLLKEEGLDAPMKDYEELVKITVLQRLQLAANYRFAAPHGEWVCPYCLGKTAILIRNWDGSDADPKMTVPEMLNHFAQCPEYQADPIDGAKNANEITSTGGERSRLAKMLAADPRFRLCDATGAWICPYAGRTVPAFNLKKERWGPELHERLLDYLLGPDCPGRYSQFEVERTLEQLQAAARTRPAVM
ncbi:MAG TPA: hypothetical protein VGP72_22980 [Planctomycetota bacterium]|jgi:hypothetical protein